MTGVNDIDAVALTALQGEMEMLGELGIHVAFAGMKGPVRDLAAKAGWTERYGREIGFLSLQAAVTWFCPELAAEPREP